MLWRRCWNSTIPTVFGPPSPPCAFSTVRLTFWETPLCTWHVHRCLSRGIVPRGVGMNYVSRTTWLTTYVFLTNTVPLVFSYSLGHSLITNRNCSNSVFHFYFQHHYHFICTEIYACIWLLFTTRKGNYHLLSDYIYAAPCVIWQFRFSPVTLSNPRGIMTLVHIYLLFTNRVVSSVRRLIFAFARQLLCHLNQDLQCLLWTCSVFQWSLCQPECTRLEKVSDRHHADCHKAPKDVHRG